MGAWPRHTTTQNAHETAITHGHGLVGDVTVSEQRLWHRIRSMLKSMGADYQRHEDVLSPGIPDISYALHGVDGWIELKYRPAWPKRAKLKLLDPAQSIWHVKRGLKGSGSVFTLAQIGREHYLIWWDCAVYIKAGISREWLRENADMTWDRGIDADELRKQLTMPRV